VGTDKIELVGVAGTSVLGIGIEADGSSGKECWELDPLSEVISEIPEVRHTS
jgi:hypothetical protein